MKIKNKEYIEKVKLLNKRQIKYVANKFFGLELFIKNADFEKEEQSDYENDEINAFKRFLIGDIDSQEFISICYEDGPIDDSNSMGNYVNAYNYIMDKIK